MCVSESMGGKERDEVDGSGRNEGAAADDAADEAEEGAEEGEGAT
jgi:hypothetical protein